MENIRILIIEDELFEAQHLALNLQQIGYHTVEIVNTGEEAISRIAQNNNVDLLIVDIVLPGDIDGIEAVKQIRQSYDIPCIFLTAHVNDELIERAERSRPYAYLLKPYKIREMEFMVKMSLARFKMEKEQAALVMLAQSDLRQAHKVIKHANEAIVIIDENGLILSVNPAFTTITGYAESEALGKNLAFLSSDRYEPTFYEGIWALANSHGKWQGEVWSCHKNGKDFPEWLTISSIYEPDGTLGRYAAIFSNISSLKEAEEEKERLQRQLSQTHKMEALGQLTGGVAHDFNNILGIIMGYVELAIGKVNADVPDTVIKYLETALTASNRAKDLVAQMLAFCRSEIRLEEPLQFEPALKENIKMLRSIIPSSISIITEYEKDLPSVLMNKDKLQQLIMNLCINAKDAIHEKGTIKINLKQQTNIDYECACCHRKLDGDWVELSVSDNGSGMTEDTLIHLFEPFFTTKDIGKGTGMGMSVVHGIITSHMGHTVVESELGVGSTIRLLFKPVETNIYQEIKKMPLPQVQLAGVNKQILVVDDEPMLAEFVGRLLELNGYQATIETDSQIALKMFLAQPDKFALVITDQIMPEVTGLDLIKEIKQIRPNFPLILCSGYSEYVDAKNALDLGIIYMDKPVNSASLLEKVKVLIGS